MIREILEKETTKDVNSLSKYFNVSVVTIRRDLNELNRAGLIERTHGGAFTTEMLKPIDLSTFQLKSNLQKEEKKLIGKYAASLVKPGNTIYLGGGTTTYWVAKNLYSVSPITVVTNSLPLANLLAQIESINLIMLGGNLKRREYTFVGEFAEKTLSNIYYDLVITGINGIHPDHGLTSNYPAELMSDKIFLSISERTIVVADHTKFGRVATYKTAELTSVKTIITDKKAPKDMVETIRKKGVAVIEV
jgi:DeoR/GlpR family transcriptional regulator of sugar metabolism